MTMAAATAIAANRRVHFEGLDWEEEDQRTEQGFRLRQERRQQKNALKMEQETRIRETFGILLTTELRQRLVALCSRDAILRLNVDLFLTLEGVGSYDGNRNLRVEAFQQGGNSDDTHYARLSPAARSTLLLIRAIPCFNKEFFAPTGHVNESSSSSSFSEDDQAMTGKKSVGMNENQQATTGTTATTAGPVKQPSSPIQSHRRRRLYNALRSRRVHMR